MFIFGHQSQKECETKLRGSNKNVYVCEVGATNSLTLKLFRFWTSE